MKTLKFIPFVFLLAVGLMSLTALNPSFSIGDKAPLTDHKMKDVVSEKDLSLSELNEKNGLLVIFSCNTCPFVLAWEDQYPKLGDLTSKNGIGMVLINSNEAKRDGEDSMAEMKKHYKSAGYNTPYVIDENSTLANAFGAKTTPHVYLFNKDLELVYRGSINDKFEEKDKTAKQFYLEEALKNLAAGRKIDPVDTREIGCSIKRIKR